MHKLELISMIIELDIEKRALEIMLAEIEARLMNTRYNLRDVELAEHGLEFMQAFIVTEQFMALQHIHERHWTLAGVGYIDSVWESGDCYVVKKTEYEPGVELVSSGIGGIPIDIVKAGIR